MRPARKRLALAATAGAVTAAAVASMFTAPAAHAASAVVVQERKWAGGCEAILYSDSAIQVSAGVYKSQNAPANMECRMWLDRSSDGVHFYIISGYHYVDKAGSSDYTAWYDDQNPLKATACVQEMSTVTGAIFADDCTPAW